MNCREAENLISAKIDGELDQDSMAPLDRHLEECSPCRMTLEQWSGLRKQLADRDAEELPMPEIDSEWQIVQSRLDTREQPRPRAVFLSFPLPWISAVAALIMVGIGLTFVRPNPLDREIVQHMAENVEYVETDIVGATPVVFVDDESGWTVVWVVESGAEIPGDTG